MSDPPAVNTIFFNGTVSACFSLVDYCQAPAFAAEKRNHVIKVALKPNG